MKKLISATLLLTCMAASRANAQDGHVKLNLNYSYGLPQGSLKNVLIDKGSARGFGADILYWFNPKFALGGSFGYQDYYQKNPRAMYKLSDGSDISAVVSNSVQLIPIMVKGMYSPLGEKQAAIQPYVSLGAGINFVNYSQFLGEFGGNEGSGKFTAQAGAGIKVPLSREKDFNFLLGANYNYTPYNRNGLSNLNTVNLQAGVQFRLK